MTTEQFIDALASQQVIDADLARQLRAKAAEGGRRVTPEALVKFLVKTDVITQWKGDELTVMLQSEAPQPTNQADDILELAPIEEDSSAAPVPRGPGAGTPPGDASGPTPGLAPPPQAPPVERAAKADRLGSAPDLDELPTVGDSSTGKQPAGMYRLGGGKGKKSKKKRTAGGKNQWDSPLILLGGGALGLLLVAAVLLYYLLFRENAAAVLADANNLFKSGAYSQAIERYREFTQRYSSHPDASQARVQLEMTRLWQSVEGGADPSASLVLAREVIANIEDEPAFISGSEEEEGLSQAKQDLGVLLVRIGDDLVAQAEASKDEKKIDSLVEDVESTLALSTNTKYVPDKFRNGPAFTRIEESLGVIRTRQARDSRLAATLAKMDAAIAGGDTAAAYAERLSLLAEYPALADDATLASKVRDVSAAEQARVKFVASDTPAETAWPQRAVVAELALAERRNAPAAGDGPPVVARVDGALYGLRSSDGALLWRRYAGHGDTGAPLLVEGGVVAANLAGGELWRLDAATGKLVWRLPLGDQVTGVTQAGESLIATGEAGKLYVINALTGALNGAVEFSQPIRTAPAINDRGDRIYVVAEHSILYTLAAKDLSCVGVYYLGHAAGAVVAPPVVVLNKVIVADNSGTDLCRVRVLSLDNNGAVDGEIAGDRLAGIAITPLATAARRVVATTTRGQVGVYDINGASDQTALTRVARRDSRDAEPLARFALLHEGKLWLAARDLSKSTILPTENQLAVESLGKDYHGDAFDAPLASVGKLVIHVRRPAGRAGAVIAATDAATNNPAWETEVAVPLAGAPAVDGARLRVTAATASGAVYVLERDDLTRGVKDKAQRSEALIGTPPPLNSSLDLGNGSLAAGADGSPRILLVRPDDPRQTVQNVSLPAPLAGALASWQGGIVSPTEVGQVFFVDPSAAAPVGTPFQPELTPDRKFQWLPAIAIGSADDAQLAISDGAERLFLVARVAGPSPHLEMVKSVDVGPSPLATPLAIVGEQIIAGTVDGRLALFSIPDLTPAEPVELGGRAVWGPFPAGDGALLATDADELMMVGRDGAIAWRRELKHGALAGQPLVTGADALLLHAAGGLSKINVADGSEAGFVEIGQPATAGPTPLGERVVVVAPDGALLVVNRP